MAKMLGKRRDGGLCCDQCTGRNFMRKYARRINRKADKREWRRNPEDA